MNQQSNRFWCRVCFSSTPIIPSFAPLSLPPLSTLSLTLKEQYGSVEAVHFGWAAHTGNVLESRFDSVVQGTCLDASEISRYSLTRFETIQSSILWSRGRTALHSRCPIRHYSGTPGELHLSEVNSRRHWYRNNVRRQGWQKLLLCLRPPGKAPPRPRNCDTKNLISQFAPWRASSKREASCQQVAKSP